ncbi:MAG: 3-oxoacyl-(acyl-carrier-protein) synthase 2 [Pelotomaculum sp. PtaU1.Bin035]|nr:MAG: 3-oxoacyl-(acyl-carrier-protein) synthase 2 [Pelotomaculum sp. PtaU1.Bin035]
MPGEIVITGMGAVTPLGIGVEAYWKGLIKGECGVDRINLFDASPMQSRIGAEVKDFVPGDFMTAKQARENDRFIQFALAAAQMAVEDSRIDFLREDSFRIGVVFGTAIGGIITVTGEQTRLLSGSRISPHFVPKFLTNMASGQISIRYGFRGPNLTITTACASGADAVGTAMHMLKRGEADVVIAGGAESIFCLLMSAGLCSAKALSYRNEEPGKASRPFDRNRDGFVLGEGAGALVIETLEHAQRREAHVLAELAGYGCCGDGYHPVMPAPDAAGEIYCMRKALDSAGISTEAVDYINAHGTSTILGDQVETKAIKEVFGPGAYRIPVSSTKGATGHMMGASGATELIACVKAIRENRIPPTINYSDPDPKCDLDYVPNTARQAKVRVAMSNSFGFGGQNACLLVKKYS